MSNVLSLSLHLKIILTLRNHCGQRHLGPIFGLFVKFCKKCWLHWFLVMPPLMTTLILNFSQKSKSYWLHWCLVLPPLMMTLILNFFEKAKIVAYIDIWFCLVWWWHWFWTFLEKVKIVDNIVIWFCHHWWRHWFWTSSKSKKKIDYNDFELFPKSKNADYIDSGSWLHRWRH
jgi:hypothetical protein